ncbi:MAG: M28 family metallopeptidase [Promethearchaeota archaeon]
MEVEISAEDANYLYDIIQKIIDEAGCRIPGSPQEAKGAEIIKKEMEETCDKVVIEPFNLHPRAFLGWIRIDIALILLSLGTFFLTNLLTEDNWPFVLISVAFGLNFIAFLIIWNEFFNYREFIDPLFKKKESQNVVGKIKAKGELKKIILFGGHHDSALQFNLLRYLKFGYPIVLFLGMGVLFLWIFLSGVLFILTLFGFIIGFTLDYSWFNDIVLFILIIGIVPMVALLFFVSSDKKANVVPGAIDNLSAVSVVLGIGRYLKNHRDIIPEGTEIRLVSFGSEEAGLRGAYRYAAKHLEELKKYDAELVNMDGIQSAKKALIIEFEPTTRTAHSQEVVNKLIEASKLVGIEAKAFGSKPIEKLVGQISGGTDATAFSKAKIKAANISAMEIKKFVKFYHQPTDKLDMIDRGALENALKICIGYLINEKNKQK